MAGNVYRLPTKTEVQARWIEKMARRDQVIDVDITVLSDDDRFREQRAWRVLFGLFQDCSCIRWSKGFRKMPGIPFSGRMRASRLGEFLNEAMPYVVDGRARIEIEGKRLRPRLLEVLAA